MPNVSRADQLQTILDKADEEACPKFFDGATEEERRDFAKATIAAYKKFNKSAQVDGPISPRHTETSRIAALAVCTLSELKTLGRRGVPEAKTALQILSARRPSWLTEYAEWLIGENPGHWPLVRTLMSRGLCNRPQHENYILGMIVCMNGFWANELIGPTHGSLMANLRNHSDLLKDEVWRLFQVEGQGELTLAAHDKYLGRKSADYCWSLALKELSKSGEIPRERLLDESLESLNRGFSQFRVAWFSQFHELLEPTVKERVKRQDKYLLLLSSSIPPTVTFALDALDIIDKEKPVAADMMIESLQPVLLAKHKGTARRAVQWLDRLASREAKCKTQAAIAATQALTHEAADVQKLAIEVLVRHGSANDTSLRNQVAQAAAGVAASLRKRLNAWLGGDAAESKPAKQPKPAGKAGGGLADLEKQIAAISSKWTRLAGIPPIVAAAKAGRIEITALNFGPLDVPRLDPAAALAPVRNLEEWIDVCAHFLEVPEEIDEGERVLEGLSRLCDQSPDDGELSRHLGPLTKRIEKVYRGYCGPFLGISLRDDVCGVVRAWTTGETVTAKGKKDQHGNIALHFADKETPVWGGRSDAPALWVFSQRSLELAERAAGRTVRPLLSAATHSGGWLDPFTFADRLLAWDKLGERPPHHDSIVALLRLAPDNRAAALKRLTKLKGELADAARYALGGEKLAIGNTAALWVAATRARDPLADDPLVENRFPGLGPGSGTAARYQWRFRPQSHTYSGKTYHFVRYHLQVEPLVPRRVERDLPTVLMNRLPEYSSSGDTAQIRWHGALWPAGREAHLVRGTRLLANNVDWSEAEWGNKTYLEPLLDGNEPLGELARTLLCLGLSAKEPGEHTLAADALAAAICDGRVDDQCLAETLAKLLTTADIKLGRWAKVFGDVARISPLHAHITRLMLENTLAAAGEALADQPKDLHHLLELLLELLAETGTAVVNSSTRDVLTRITGGGKAARVAKALLATLAETDDASFFEIARAALQGRLDRARRWDRGTQS